MAWIWKSSRTGSHRRRPVGRRIWIPVLESPYLSPVQEGRRRKVAVLLATYNGAEFLSEQIDSLFRQARAEIYLFARDDFSNDETIQILKDYASRYPLRLTIINDALGRSGSAGSNFLRLVCAVNPCEFDFVAFADQDDVWLSDKIHRAISMLESSDADGYSSNLVAVDPTRPWTEIIDKSQPQRRFDHVFQTASAGCTYVLTCKAAQQVRDVISRLDRLPANVRHDWTIYAICRSRGLRWSHDAEAHIIYRQHGRNVHGALPGFTGLLARLRSSQSGWYSNHVLWLANILERGGPEQQIVERFQRGRLADRFWLLAHARSFRRRTRDQVLLGLALFTGLIRGSGRLDQGAVKTN